MLMQVAKRAWWIVFPLLFVVACVPTVEGISAASTDSTDAAKNNDGTEPVAQAFRDAGAAAQVSPNLTWSNVFNDLFRNDVADLWDVQVNGETIRVYVFATEDRSQAAAATVGPSGDQFTLTRQDGSTVEMFREYEKECPPRYWHQDQFIVYYAGQDQATLDLMDATFGERIADATRPYQPNTPGHGIAGTTEAGVDLQYDPYLIYRVRLERYPSDENPVQLRLVMESFNLHEIAFTPMIVVAREPVDIGEFVPGVPLSDEPETMSFQNGTGASWTTQVDGGEWAYVARGQTDDAAHHVLLIYPILKSRDSFTPDPALLDAVFASLRVEPEW